MHHEEAVTVTITVPLPDIQFADDDERKRFQAAVQAAAEFYEALIDPEENTDLLVIIGDSILRKHDFDPITWLDNLWSIAAAARLQLRAKSSHAPGHA